MDSMLYLAPVMGIVALLFAFYLASKVGKQDAGTDRMKEIGSSDQRRRTCFPDV